MSTPFSSQNPQSVTVPNKNRGMARIAISASVIVTVLVISLLIRKPAMPDQILLLAGSENSAYYHIAQLYVEELQRNGLEAKVKVTNGSLENVQGVFKSKGVVAFAPSTIDWEKEADIDESQLVTLGSIGYEPLWLFYRSELGISRIPDLAGKIVATKGKGSSSEYVARELVDRNGISRQVTIQSINNLTAEVLIEGFSSKTIDAGFVTGDLHSPLVQSMVNEEDVSFLSFDRSSAYAELISGVTTFKIPEGMFNLARNIPEQDAELLASTTCLIAHENLHPSVVSMLLAITEKVRKKNKTLTTSATFPNPDNLTLHLHPAARRYFQHGETGLSKYLPYNLTRYLNHLGLYVLPLLTVTIILLKVIPTGFRFYFQFRLRGFLKRLVEVERGNIAGKDPAKLIASLDRIEQESFAMFLPHATAHDYIDFRQFLHDLRERVEKND